VRRYRLPATLLNGTLRTSTLLLSLLFVAVLTLYLEVRPPPVGTTSSDGSRQAEPSQPTASVPATTSATSAPAGSPTTPP
jgi:hypothetical protein